MLSKPVISFILYFSSVQGKLVSMIRGDLGRILRKEKRLN